MDEEIIKNTKFNYSNFFKQNKFKLIWATALVIISVIVLLIFNEYKKTQDINISEKYNKAKILIEKNDPNKSLKLLEEIILKKNSFYSPSALNLIIDNNLVKDKEKVLIYFEKVISNSKLDLETKNLFIFKKTIYMGDAINENELLSNLKPIIQSNSLWKNTASDYIKKYYLSKGEFNKAKEFEVSK
tara:strand:+ start:185 stop:745 length:561 start_codon:yes stop_codon:yes gene_type:complete